MSSSTSPTAFSCLRLETTVARAEWAVAEAWAAGASGVEERERGDRIVLLVYAPTAQLGAVSEALRRVVGVDAALRAEPVAVRDWPETWKQGIGPLVVSERLVVRPPFASGPGPASGFDLVIEPRQAFGTGGHASTALALALLDARLLDTPAARVLDVGAGSGVLAIAALGLGARFALACDLDPIAARETRENAVRNGVATRLRAFTGSLDALAPRAGRFDLVVANLISSELAPILPALAARLAPGGALVLSGLLIGERVGQVDALGALGLAVRAERSLTDARDDAWLALMATR